MTRRARGPCLPRARVMVWVRSARNPNPLAVTTLSPHPYSHIVSVRWGWFFFFKWEGKLRLDPPSLTFSTPRKPLYSRCLAWAPPFHGALPLHRFPATLRQKNLRRPHGVDRLFFCLTERGNSHRPQWGGRWRDRFYGPKLPASLGYLPLQ